MFTHGLIVHRCFKDRRFKEFNLQSVAVPGFDLRGGGRGLCQRGGGGVRKSLKVLIFEVKSNFSVFLPYFY